MFPCLADLFHLFHLNLVLLSGSLCCPDFCRVFSLSPIHSLRIAGLTGHFILPPDL